MKRLLAAACILAIAPLAWGQLYKWVDKDGKVHYSDTPPPSGDSKQIQVNTGGGTPAAAPTSPPAKGADAPKADPKEAAKKAEDDAKRAAFDAERCTRARSYLKTLTDGGRLTTTVNGERVIMDETMIESEKARAQKTVDEACKS